MAGKNIIQSIDDLSPRAKGELRAWIETWMRQHPIDATDNQGFTYGVRSEDIVQGKVNEGYVLTATGLGGSRWGLIPGMTDCTPFPDAVAEIQASHPANSLLGYWRLGDGASPFADTSGHYLGPADAAKVVSGTAMTDSVTGALPPGDDDGAVQFNAANYTNGEFLHSGGSRFNIGNSDFSIAAYVYPLADSHTFRGQIAGTIKPNIVLGAMGGYALWCDWPTRTVVFTRSQSTALASPIFADASGGVLPASTWSLVVGTYVAATHTQSIYVNGVLVGTGDGSAVSIGDEYNTVSIGGSQNPPIDFTSGPGFPRPGWFYGGLDEVMIWTVALSSSEVASLYTSGQPCTPGFSSCCDTGGGPDYPTTVLSVTDLVAYWRFGEGAAPYADTSGYKPADPFNAVMVAAGTTAMTQDYTPGALTVDDDGAVAFNVDGTSAIPGSGAPGEHLHATCSTDTFRTSFIGTDPFTVACWIKPFTSARTYRGGIVGTLSMQAGDYQGWYLYLNNPTRTIGFGRCGVATGTTPVVAETASGVTADSWHFVVGTYDSANLRIYVDGVLEDTQAMTDAIGATSTDNPPYFGVIITAPPSLIAQYFYGAIDECAIWSRDLTAGEITSLYESNTLGGNEPAGKVLTSDGTGGASYAYPTVSVDGTRYDEIVAGTGLNSTNNMDGTVTLSSLTTVYVNGA